MGLGNVWRFSYVTGENGGGAFLLVDLTMVLLVGVPLLLGEFGLGRSTQRESAAAFEALAPKSRWRHLGLLGVIVAGLILAYHAAIAGWVLKYLSLHLMGSTQAFAATGFADAFRAFITHPLKPIAWQFAARARARASMGLGWVWHRRDALPACDLQASRWGRCWRWSVRYTVPLLVAVVRVRNAWEA